MPPFDRTKSSILLGISGSSIEGRRLRWTHRTRRMTTASQFPGWFAVECVRRSGGRVIGVHMVRHRPSVVAQAPRDVSVPQESRCRRVEALEHRGRRIPVRHDADFVGAIAAAFELAGDRAAVSPENPTNHRRRRCRNVVCRGHHVRRQSNRDAIAEAVFCRPAFDDGQP